MSCYKASAHFQRIYYKQRKLGGLLGATKSVYTLIIQLIFLQHYSHAMQYHKLLHGMGINACVLLHGG